MLEVRCRTAGYASGMRDVAAAGYASGMRDVAAATSLIPDA